MKKVIIGILIFTAIAFITNPQEKKHKDAAKRELDATLDKELGLVGEFLSAQYSLEGKAVGKFIVRQNHYLYSTTILKIGKEEKVVGYGFFGFVFINRAAFNL